VAIVWDAVKFKIEWFIAIVRTMVSKKYPSYNYLKKTPAKARV
jgi:hypothetical protein